MIPSSSFRYDIFHTVLKIGGFRNASEFLEPVTCSVDLCEVFELIDINGYDILGYA